MQHTKECSTPWLDYRIAEELIRPAVKKVRSQLLLEYPDNINLEGLCNKAVEMLQTEFYVLLSNNRKYDSYNVVYGTLHGELTHSPKILSKYWPIQHTIAVISVNDTKFFVDPTSSQFNDILEDVNDYYISTVKPKWFYPDKSNPVWNGITKTINNKIHIHAKIAGLDYNLGIVEWMQFYVWGSLSDMIHKRFYS